MNAFVLLSLISMTALSGCNTSSAVGAGSSGTGSKALVGSKSGGLEVVSSLPAPDNIREGSSQLIYPNDLLEIDVFQVDELDRSVRVNSQGNISMPLIGTVKAGNKSVPQLEETLKQRYGANYLQSPQITVLVKESTGQTVTMDGEFKKPGVLPVSTQSTLIRVVAQAGGISDIADEKKLFVYRKYKTGTKVAQYSVSDIRAGKALDPKIHGGDVVVAFTSSSKIATRNLRDALGVASSATRLAVGL